MAIYTRKGDEGRTRLADGARVSKLHPRIEAVGAVDELSSALGLARGLVEDREIGAALARIQAQLIQIGSALSAPRYASGLSDGWAADLERAIDKAEAELPRQTDWVLPGATAGSGALHLARSVCRRAERAALRVCGGQAEDGANPPLPAVADPPPAETQVILPYLNRLSDYLHVLGRLEEHRHLVRRIAGRVAEQMAAASDHGASDHGGRGQGESSHGAADHAASPPLGGALTGVDCDRLIAAAEQRARSIGVPMVIAVVDDGGILKAFKRMDGALLASVQIAMGKAYTSAALRMPSGEVGAQAQPGAPLYGIALAEPGRIITFAGGLPLRRHGAVIGAIGVSGGMVEEDEDVARAGEQALA